MSEKYPVIHCSTGKDSIIELQKALAISDSSAKVSADVILHIGMLAEDLKIRKIDLISVPKAKNLIRRFRGKSSLNKAITKDQEATRYYDLLIKG